MRIPAPNQQEREGPEQLEERLRQLGAEHRADGAATRDDPEEPLALLLGVEVVGEGPELRGITITLKQPPR